MLVELLVLSCKKSIFPLFFEIISKSHIVTVFFPPKETQNEIILPRNYKFLFVFSELESFVCVSYNFCLGNFFVPVYMSILPACSSMYHVCAWCPRKPEEDFGYSGTRVTDRCELLLEEQTVLCSWAPFSAFYLPFFYPYSLGLFSVFLSNLLI